MKSSNNAIPRGVNYLTLILRLVLDAKGEFKQGSCVAANGEIIATFARLEDLPSLIASAIRQQARTDEDESLL